jgi:hypothetical protein
VKLQVWNYGRRLFTTVEAIERFARELAVARSQEPRLHGKQVRGVTVRRAGRVAAAERELAGRGM